MTSLHKFQAIDKQSVGSRSKLIARLMQIAAKSQGVQPLPTKQLSRQVANLRANRGYGAEGNIVQQASQLHNSARSLHPQMRYVNVNHGFDPKRGNQFAVEDNVRKVHAHVRSLLKQRTTQSGQPRVSPLTRRAREQARQTHNLRGQYYDIPEQVPRRGLLRRVDADAVAATNSQRKALRARIREADANDLSARRMSRYQSMFGGKLIDRQSSREGSLSTEAMNALPGSDSLNRFFASPSASVLSRNPRLFNESHVEKLRGIAGPNTRYKGVPTGMTSNVGRIEPGKPIWYSGNPEVAAGYASGSRGVSSIEQQYAPVVAASTLNRLAAAGPHSRMHSHLAKDTRTKLFGGGVVPTLDEIFKRRYRGKNKDWAARPDYEQVFTMPSKSDWVRDNQLYVPDPRSPGELRQISHMAFPGLR